MERTNSKLIRLAKKMERNETIKVAILGFGSVGGYLLDYLLNWNYEDIEIHVASRNLEKTQQGINIERVALGIRKNRTKCIIPHVVDLESLDSTVEFMEEVSPDFVVNASRVYSGLKYGSLSWNNVRAYGIWSPLAISLIKNIMQAYEIAGSQAIVINTSYSDAVIPWLRSAGKAYPDFGSGNLNHLVPRIKFGVLKQLGLGHAYEDVNVTLATSHFHDVVISKEGHCNGVEPLCDIRCSGLPVAIDRERLWKDCMIQMPTDSKRNMMNASSNFEIISKILRAIKDKNEVQLHIPGMAGYLGGYPVTIDFSDGTKRHIYFDERYFTLESMMDINQASIALDGIQNIVDGRLIYTDQLLSDVHRSFGVNLPKEVPFEDCDSVAQFIIDEIIIPNTSR